MALRALQGPAGGTAPVGTLGGTTNTIPRWTGPSTLGDSVISQDNGTNRLLIAGGTAAAAANGTNITIQAQTGGTGNTNGGDIILLGGVRSGSGTFGRVGVGTSKPVARVTIGSEGLNVNNPTLGNAVGVPLLISSADPTIFGLVMGCNAGDGRSWIQAMRTDGSATPYNITLNELGGNVGIGTASPTAGTRLHVLDSAGSAIVRVQSTTAGTGGNVILQGATFGQVENIAGDLFVTNSSATGAILFRTAATNIERMRISASGTQAQSQVAIGTSSFTTGRALTTVADVDVFGVRVGRGGGDVAGNTCIGAGAMAATATGADNVACGKNALAAVLGGARNVVVGAGAGNTLTGGADHVILGQAAQPFGIATTNEIVIGSGATGNGSDLITIGNQYHVGAILDVKYVRIKDSYTVGTLPAAGTAGRIARVTDGDAALAWGATVVNTGAGATPYLVWDNGTNWTVFGK